MLAAELFTRTKVQQPRKQPKRPSIDEQLKKIQYTTENEKRMKLSHLQNMDGPRQCDASEITQTEQDKSFMLLLMCGI